MRHDVSPRRSSPGTVPPSGRAKSSCQSRAMVFAAMLGGLFTSPVQAQFIMELPASKALECLTPPGSERGVPAYPPNNLGRLEAATVEVELSFDDAGFPPSVRVLRSDGYPELEDAVKTHVAGYRVPCLAQTGGRAVLRFSFVFKPERRQVTSEFPNDESTRRDAEMMRCLRKPANAPIPEYPEAARRDAQQGRVLARLRFVAADQPPEVQTYTASRQLILLERSAERWLQQLRLPCHSGAPVEAELTLIYRFEDNPAYGFRDLPLRRYMALVKDISKQRLVMDLSAMSCPFDVRLTYRQPQLPNRVEELDTHDPARQPLLQWLAGTELNLNPLQRLAAYGDRVTISVPCGAIRLEPTA